MSGFASSVFSQTAGARSGSGRDLPEDVIQRRMKHRRNNLATQFGSYLATALIMSIYVAAGVVPAFLPLAFAVCGTCVIGSFLALSQTRFNDNFEDHYLTLWQIAAHVAIQLGFMMIAPQIGFLFFCIVVLIFSFGTLRMTSRQATISWTLLTAGVLPIFLLGDLPIAMPAGTFLERVAALLCFVATIGQCTHIGLYGSRLRKELYKSSQALRTAYQRIEELAQIDELTGAFNRRAIMRALDDEITRAARLRHPCSIALIDLDWFKRINDALGHPAGDEVLRTFAIATFANIRDIDSFGRYGGEEFLLVLPETPHADAERIMERLRIIIADLDWSGLAHGMSQSISAGVATFRPGETADACLARADAALYSAKRGGRNRIAAAA